MRRKFQHQRCRQEVQESSEAGSGKQRHHTFRDVLLTSFCGRFLFSEIEPVLAVFGRLGREGFDYLFDFRDWALMSVPQARQYCTFACASVPQCGQYIDSETSPESF